MTSKQRSKCHTIIHTASVACASVGAGLAQFPGSDNAVIVPIQLTMITSLGVVFEKTLTKENAIAILASQVTTPIGRTISQVLIGWLPGIGNVVNASTAAGITEALGWAVANMFDEDEDKQPPHTSPNNKDDD